MTPIKINSIYIIHIMFDDTLLNEIKILMIQSLNNGGIIQPTKRLIVSFQDLSEIFSGILLSFLLFSYYVNRKVINRKIFFFLNWPLLYLKTVCNFFFDLV